jgi:Flagellar hook-length control protein FliK
MAILVSNPSPLSPLSLSADVADPALAAFEAGFTEELSVAMRSKCQASEQGAEGMTPSLSDADEKSQDLQILPPDVLLNAVGDANFALGTPAVQPPFAIETPVNAEVSLTTGDPLDAAELAAAALAAQGVQGAQALPTVQSAVSPTESVSALGALRTGSSSAGAGESMSAMRMTDSLNQEAQAALALQSNAPESVVSDAVPVLPSTSIEIMSGGSAHLGMPSVDGFSSQGQTWIQAQVPEQIMPLNQTALPVALDPQVAVRSLPESDAVAQGVIQQGAPVLVDVSTQSTVSALDLIATPAAHLSSSEEAAGGAMRTQTTLVMASLPAAASEQEIAAVATTKILEASGQRLVVSATSDPGPAAQEEGRSAENDLPATLLVGAEPVSEHQSPVAVQAHEVSADQTPLANTFPTESAFKFDAKLTRAVAVAEKSAVAPADPALSQSPDTRVASIASGVTGTPRADRLGIDRKESVLDGPAEREELGILATAMQPLTVASSEKVNASPAKSFDEISSTFVSSLVGGAQRPVTTVMDWVSLQPQARPAAVEPHEIRLDAGAVQVEIQRMVKQGGGQVVMELTPPDQSKFTIELKLDERGGAYLVVDGASDSTRTRLEQSAPQLHEQFQQMGLNLQLDMRQHRESAFSGSQESLSDGNNTQVQSSEPTAPMSRAAVASRARDAGVSQVYLYA